MSIMLRRMSIPVLVVALMAAVGVATAHADSPHFIQASAGIDNAGNLTVSFKEVGLGNTVTTEAITANADATAVYACINGGGKHPKATNKATVSGPVSGGGSFPVRNGSTSGTLTVSPPGPGSFSCPSGQTMVLVSVSYTNVSVAGAAGDAADIAGTFSKTFFNL